MSVPNANNFFQVRLTLTTAEAAPTDGLALFALEGDDPTGTSTAPPTAHGLGVGGDGSLWTSDGVAWLQVAGTGGTLGPIPTGTALVWGTESEGNTRAQYIAGADPQFDVTAGNVTAGPGIDVALRAGTTSAPGEDGGNLLLAAGLGGAGGDSGQVQLGAATGRNYIVPAPAPSTGGLGTGLVPLRMVGRFVPAGNGTLTLTSPAMPFAGYVVGLTCIYQTGIGAWTGDTQVNALIAGTTAYTIDDVGDVGGGSPNSRITSATSIEGGGTNDINFAVGEAVSMSCITTSHTTGTVDQILVIIDIVTVPNTTP